MRPVPPGERPRGDGGRTVLIVDGDRASVETVADGLRRAGHVPVAVGRGGDGLALLRDLRPALIILDLDLPDLDGLEVCRRVRLGSGVPVLILTARADEASRIAGLSAGADDYVTKPFSLAELLLRVGNLLRRRPEGPADLALVRVGAFVIDPARYEASVRGAPVRLPTICFRLLHVLAAQPGRVFSREELLRAVWSQAEGAAGGVQRTTVDVHIRSLRERIEADPSRPRHVLTVRRAGYKFCPDGPAEDGPGGEAR